MDLKALLKEGLEVKKLAQFLAFYHSIFWKKNPVPARTKVLNQEWEDCFRQWYPGFRLLPVEPLLITT